MKLTEHALDWLAQRFGVPLDAMRMFRAANFASGLEKETLPSELIPLNTTQFARGLLNFTILQSIHDWVLPFWAVRQFDHSGPSFIPRSHLGLSINVTHRNWTAVGNMECDIEPIVDPRGLVTPLRNSWSIDFLLMTEGKVFFPSRSSTVSQRLVDNCPVVETEFDVDGILVTLRSFVDRTELVHTIAATNRTLLLKHLTLGIALRPFNPEGIALINEIVYDPSGMRLNVNKNATFQLSAQPDRVLFGSYDSGDSMMQLARECAGNSSSSIRCPVGLANTVAVFEIDLGPGETRVLETTYLLEERSIRWDQVATRDSPERSWQTILAEGSVLTTPDERINAIVRASLSTLLLLIDKDSITPGPFTYHLFWFRDAAYMIAALDRFGFSKWTGQIIRAFARHQTKNGYFCSQQGEWDSNGQALWTTWQHSLTTGDRSLLHDMMVPLQRGYSWIDTTRMTGKEHARKPWFGLMPRGLSAEHLGLVDHYFWDNFWSLAGMEAYIGICDVLGLENESARARRSSSQFRADIERAISSVQQHFRTSAIPASPTRGIDCGMIGSICAAYPLQLMPANDHRIIHTVEILSEKFSHNGMFFQQFIHSGANPYLSLQIAHVWLFAGDRERFWTMLNRVIDCATPTWNFPEAIHPITHGGVMGDGHHGWAAAEIVLAMRDAFVYDTARISAVEYELILLSGIPASWFTADRQFSLTNAPLPGASMDITVSSSTTSTEIVVDWREQIEGLRVKMAVILPFIDRKVSWRGGVTPTTSTRNNTMIAETRACSFTLVLRR